jgi:hypothetical protein
MSRIIEFFITIAVRTSNPAAVVYNEIFFSGQRLKTPFHYNVRLRYCGEWSGCRVPPMKGWCRRSLDERLLRKRTEKEAMFSLVS